MESSKLLLAVLSVLTLLGSTWSLDAAMIQVHDGGVQSHVPFQQRFDQGTVGVISPYSVADQDSRATEPKNNTSAGPFRLLNFPRIETRADPGLSLIPAVSSSQSSSAIALLSKFEGLNQIQSCQCVPPDVQVATGPSQVVEMVNLEGAVFTKQGVVNKTFSLSTFFRSGFDSVSDPKVIFDAPSQRWFTSLLDISLDEILLGVSTTSNANGSFVFYAVSAGSTIPDQPILGVSDDKVAIAANDFAGNTFAGSQYWILNKSQLLAGSTVNFITSGANSGVFSVHPVQSLSNTTIQFMVSNIVGRRAISTTSLRLFSITGIPGVSTVSAATTDLTITTIGTLSGGVLPGGAQPGTSVTVNTNDFRVEDAVWFKGTLWLGLNDACTPTGDTQTRSCIRLTKISTTSPTTVSQDFDFGTRMEDVYYPGLRIDRSGNLLLVFGYSNATIFPSLAITGRLSADPSGSLASPRSLRIGSASDTSTRYGDYFGAALDPVDPTVVWVAGEYHANSTGSCQTFGSCWSTFVGSAAMTGFTVSTSPSSVTVSAARVGGFNVTLSSLNGFIGQITINATGPIGFSVSPALTSVSLISGNASIPLTLSVAASLSPGPYPVIVVASNRTTSRTTTLTAIVQPDFTISLTCPCSSILAVGGRLTENLTLTSVNGFAGQVALAASVSPTASGGPMVTLGQTSQMLSLGGHSSATLAVASGNRTGIFTITVTGVCVSGQCSTPAQQRSVQFLITQTNPVGGSGRRPVLA